MLRSVQLLLLKNLMASNRSRLRSSFRAGFPSLEILLGVRQHRVGVVDANVGTAKDRGYEFEGDVRNLPAEREPECLVWKAYQLELRRQRFGIVGGRRAGLAFEVIHGALDGLVGKLASDVPRPH